MKRLMLVLAAAVLLPGAAQANVYGNAARPITQGSGSVGFGFTELTRSLKLDVSITSTSMGTATGSDTDDQDYSEQLLLIGFAVSDTVELLGRFGTTTYKFDDYPNEFGPTTGFGGRFLVSHDPGGTSVGALFLYTTSGYKSDFETLKMTQLDVAIGASFPADENVSLYGAGVFSTVSGTVEATDETLRDLENVLGLPQGDLTDVSGDISQDKQIGAIAGVEFKVGESAFIGGEMHIMFEQGFAFFANIVF